MKKKIFAALLAMTLALTSVPVLAAPAEGGKAVCTSTKIVNVDVKIEKAPSNAIPVQSLDVDSEKYAAYFDSLNDDFEAVTALDGKGSMMDEKEAAASGEKAAAFKPKPPKKAGALKIEGRYYDEIDFSCKAPKTSEELQYYMCLVSEANKKMAKVNKEKTGFLGPIDYIGAIATPTTNGRLYSIPATTYAGITPGNTIYLGIITRNSAGFLAMTGLKKVVVPDRPIFEMNPKIEVKYWEKLGFFGMSIKKWTVVTAEVYNHPTTMKPIKFLGKYSYADAYGNVKRDGKCRLATYSSEYTTNSNLVAAFNPTSGTIKPNSIGKVKYRCDGWKNPGAYAVMDYIYEGGHWVNTFVINL